MEFFWYTVEVIQIMLIISTHMIWNTRVRNGKVTKATKRGNICAYHNNRYGEFFNKWIYICTIYMDKLVQRDKGNVRRTYISTIFVLMLKKISKITSTMRERYPIFSLKIWWCSRRNSRIWVRKSRQTKHRRELVVEKVAQILWINKKCKIFGKHKIIDANQIHKIIGYNGAQKFHLNSKNIG